MFGFQELFDQHREESFQAGNLGLRILEYELENIKLSLTEEQRLDLKNNLIIQIVIV